MDISSKKINFMGDSITEGCGTSRGKKRFTGFFEDRCAVSRNYGVIGSRIARQPDEHITNDDCDRDFCLRVAEMDADADIVFVFGGTNDYGHGEAPLGNMSDRTPYTFYGAMHTLCRSLIEKYPEAVIAFATPMHRLNDENPRGDGSKPADVAPLKKYVEIIREVAEFYSLPVLDLFASSGLQPQVPVIQEKYIPDGLHPNDDGHRILSEKILSFFNSL